MSRCWFIYALKGRNHLYSPVQITGKHFIWNLAKTNADVWFSPDIQSKKPGWEHSECFLCTCQACDSVWSPFRPTDGFPAHRCLTSPSVTQRLMCVWCLGPSMAEKNPVQLVRLMFLHTIADCSERQVLWGSAWLPYTTPLKTRCKLMSTA